MSATRESLLKNTSLGVGLIATTPTYNCKNMKISKTCNGLIGILIIFISLNSCNRNEYAPEIVDQEFTVEENSKSGTIIGAVDASDSDEDQLISFEIIDGNLNETFEIDPFNGILSVADPTILDYEENTQFRLTVAVSDNHKKPMEASAKIQINVNDVNEFAPVISIQTFIMEENPLNGYEIGIIQAEDEDSHQQLIYSFVNPDEVTSIAIDSVTGALSVVDSTFIDFESIKEFSVLVMVRDDHPNFKSAIATITIDIKNVREITDELVAYFPFNGNALDESGNNIASQVLGPILTNDRFGNPNSAIEFDGVNDYIRLNNNEPLITSKSFTISLWAKIYGDSPVGLWGNAFFEQRDNARGSYTVKSVLYFRGDYNGNMLLHTRSSTDVTIQDLRCNYVVDANWHHYVAKIDENRTMEIYFDGVLFCTGVFPNDGDFVTSIDHVGLGAHHPDGVLRAGLFGIMDEVYLHNRALSSNEIFSLFSVGVK